MRTRFIGPRLVLLGFVLGSACTVSAQETASLNQKTDAEWQRYSYVLRSSTLEWLPSEPFLIRVDYELYDLNGNPTVKGTAEESWSKDGKLIRIESPSLTEDPAVAIDELKTRSRESFLVHQAITALVHPFPSATKQADFATDEFHQTIRDVDASCFSIISPGKTRTPDTPAYCLDADNHIVSLTGPLFVLERNDFRRYRTHIVPADLKLTYEGRLALVMHVTELDPLPPPADSKFGAKASLSPTIIPGAVLAEHFLKKKAPSYPKEAKKKHITGSVIVAAIITKQGTIVGMDVIASPDPLLTKSATDAVQTWTYEPYILNGAPTEVETTITVNFNMGR